MQEDKKKFYITTTLPYVNAEPHIGHAMEFVRADVIARYQRLMGHDVFFNTGTDEHGSKLYEGAMTDGVTPQQYVDKYSERFKDFLKLANISNDAFIRTTDEKHIVAAQEIWKRCFDKGYIYKKNYQSKYCVGCELNKTDSELEDGKCPIHPNRDVELIDEENYFFKFSELQQPLLDFYKANPDFVIPSFRFNEIRSFVERGLEDFSISRLKSKMPWGVDVPGDAEHVMYVWFDALTSYISTLGWPEEGEESDFAKYWSKGNPVQYCGKDNLRQQSAMWQAMLMAAGLPNSKHIIIDGFITSGGQKMSKSLGNVISPFDVLDAFKDVTDYPEDVLRFVLLHDISSFEDGDVTMESIKESYRSQLQNGIGNLTSRIMKMATSNNLDINSYLDTFGREINAADIASINYHEGFKNFDLKKTMEAVMYAVSWADKHIQSSEPFKVIKINKEQGEAIIFQLVRQLSEIAHLLRPLLPSTSEKILECIRENKMPEKPLFNRLEK
jgi:methionyl-tRNA synthetase